MLSNAPFLEQEVSPLNKKRQKAVALRYQPEELAPKILAKGAGVIAEKILEKAANADIKLHKDAALVDELTRLDLGEYIPPELYEVVAQILIFICDLDKNANQGAERVQPKSSSEHFVQPLHSM